MQFDVKIRRIINDNTAVKAVASVTVEGALAIHNVRVIESGGTRFIAMPYSKHKDRYGNEIRRDLVHPISSEVRKALEAAVFSAYEQKISEKAQ